MEKQGNVSLWIGKINTEEDLNDYLKLVYTDDGESLPSPFLKDFEIELSDFDEDFIEAVFRGESVGNLECLIEGCSYDDIVIPLFGGKNRTVLPDKTNSAILLYNFDYQGRKKEIRNKDYVFEYLGSVKYS
ncbi:immunity 22 family protein [Metabacillus arenae]|uniref:Immunity 22 family protein n=1 Tax=Metabacillus arenae TaxID=2771434 RepID=A0A926NE78_9BACI|nr:immunity 22 family protein [Metabacillus arenae]MBD1382627.1 immunity 22 family protein [Metabacillus arenae]